MVIVRKAFVVSKLWRKVYLNPKMFLLIVKASVKRMPRSSFRTLLGKEPLWAMELNVIPKVPLHLKHRIFHFS